MYQVIDRLLGLAGRTFPELGFVGPNITMDITKCKVILTKWKS